VYVDNRFAPADSAYRCVPDDVDLTQISADVSLLEELYPRCGEDTCRSPSYYPDTDFDDAQCKPYEFSGMESNYYCYGDEPPPQPKDRCGDAFTAAVLLSTDWKLYKLPFSEFRQVGFGKIAPAFDLHTVSLIGFLFTVGYIDVYIDNVSFYRDLP
jgi:hypothetical protein